MPTQSVTARTSVSTHLLGVDLLSTSTTKSFPLGTLTSDGNGGWYEYIRADAALGQYAAVKVDDDGEATELDTTLSGAEPTRVASVQVAFADTEYGWGARMGNFTQEVLISCAADVKLYTTATAGALDDTATDLVQGVKILTAEPGSGTANIAAFSAIPMATNAQD